MKFLKRLRKKWVYSFVGLWTALKEERSLWAYFIIFPILIGIGVWLKLENTEWAVISVTMFVVICVEVINTALEAAIDSISFQYNIKVKKTKDIASGATLVMTIGAITTFLIIFIPAFEKVV